MNHRIRLRRKPRKPRISNKFFYEIIVITPIILLISFFVAPVRSFDSARDLRAKEKEILDEILGTEKNPTRYDKRIRPAGQPKNDTSEFPLMVEVNMMIRSISRIDDVAMEYAVQITHREEWNDTRLEYSDKLDMESMQIQYLVLTDPKRIWMPDLFFRNEKQGHNHEIIMPNVLVRIYPTGRVLFSIRLSLTLFCPMDLHYFPLDKQTCDINMGSYGYTSTNLKFYWRKTDPVQIPASPNLPRFALDKWEAEDCEQGTSTSTGNYTCIRVRLTFKREFSYYLIQIYFPCVMLVIVSWVSFWLDPNAIPARVSLGVTTLLTMATQISGINASLPPVSYIKAIDVWTESCLTFVFMALLEFALVNYASRSDAHRAAQRSARSQLPRRRPVDIEQMAFDQDGIENEALAFVKRPLPRNVDELAEKLRVCEIHSGPPRSNILYRWLDRFPTRSKQIDVLSRICFPLGFLCFNFAYWSRYLNTDQGE
ncbi:glutamate-gated chloride channel-like [Brevipalpus obovatus]|uniref:glutamate-gated chloride channel-like n=1 Tax=Brevipalpus obovatus TaxID=246614 RepID=UPI003D9F6F39